MAEEQSLKLPNEQSFSDENLAPILKRMLSQKGFELPRGARLLDFGCGEGRLVYEYRDMGYEAYGFDILPTAKLRDEHDQEFFLYSLTGQPPYAPDYSVDPRSYRIPAEDNSFDFVFSISTLEHILDYDTAFLELARVTRRGGIGIHVFPARYMRIEHHMNIPYGGRIQNYAWYYAWTLLGFRPEHHKELSVTQSARTNLIYAKNCLNYLPVPKITRLAGKYFNHVEIDPKLWELRIPDRKTFWAALLQAPGINRAATWWYNRACTLVLFLIK